MTNPASFCLIAASPSIGRSWLPILTLTAVPLFAQEPTPTSTVESAPTQLDLARQKASQRLADLTEAGPAPAWSVAVARNGEIVFAEARGLANVKSQTAATVSTRFRIGSTSKALTSIALGQLVEEGKLDLDAPFRKLLPEFPAKEHDFTCRQLAGHQAGIRHYRGAGEYFSATRYTSVVNALGVFKDDPLLFEPGTQYAYSTYGFTLLSAAMEKADGRGFLQLMEERIFAPLGMQNTGPEFEENRAAGRATYYSGMFGIRQETQSVDNSNKWAGGGFESTPTDLATFGAALLEGELVKNATRELFFTPQTLRDGVPTEEHYGIGWRSHSTTLPSSDSKVRIVHHGGTALGGRSFLVLLPDHELVVSALANYHSSNEPFTDFSRGALEFADLFLQIEDGDE